MAVGELVLASQATRELRALYAYSDLQVIAAEAGEVQAIDDYARQGMADMLIATDKEFMANPLVRRLIVHQETLGIKSGGGVRVVDIVDQITGTEATSRDTLSKTAAKEIAKRHHSDKTTSAHTSDEEDTTDDVIDDVPESPTPEDLEKTFKQFYTAKDKGKLDLAVAQFGVSGLSHKSDPQTLEIQRYRSFVGLQNAHQTKYTSREAADAAIRAEHAKLTENLPYAILSKVNNVIAYMLGYDDITQQFERPLSQLYGRYILETLDSCGQYLRAASVDPSEQVANDLSLGLILSRLVDSVDSAMLHFAISQIAPRPFETKGEVDQYRISQIAGVFKEAVDRIKVLKTSYQSKLYLDVGLKAVAMATKQNGGYDYRRNENKEPFEKRFGRSILNSLGIQKNF